MTDAVFPNGGGSDLPLPDLDYFKKGCNPLAQTGRSKLQNQRATLNQQIIKEMRLRAGAENLLRATSNHKIREMATLELSYVNSNLQLLKEELEGLNSSVEVYQNVEEVAAIPLIPLGLKETKEVDFTVPFKDFILEHYGEDGSVYDSEIADFMDLRQACRTPSRNEAGIALLVNYFSQLSFTEARFFTPSKHIGVYFTWYDCFTGVPVCQQNISLEKASILFNIAAIYTQIGTRCDRQSVSGLDNCIDSFQKAAGVLSHLKETFTHTPSYDMSPAMLSVLVKMMIAQAQESVYEKICLPGICNEYFSLLKMAQESAKVSEVYKIVLSSMNQTPIKENIPASWAAMVQVKAEHYKALAHYFMAVALLDRQLTPADDEDKQEKALSQVYDTIPDGLLPVMILKTINHRSRIGKAHLHKAIMCHEEAIRALSLCRNLRRLDIVQEILSVAHKRSLNKYAMYETEDDFVSYMDAPELVSYSEQNAEMVPFHLSKGPLSVFCAKNRLMAPRTVHLVPENGDLGFTLRGGMPAQVNCLDPLCAAANAGLREGDYIVSVEQTDCKWLGVTEVTNMLKAMDETGVIIQVVNVQDPSYMTSKSATYSGAMQKTYSMICLDVNDDSDGKAKTVSKKLSFLSWGVKKRQKATSTISIPSAIASSSHAETRLSAAFSNDSSVL
ncbi:rhophilin-2 isoform X2 [Protopterus annectens]|uniref:rhophilin-2 isoform X2 n=1 Tax=Protopterus annectens TaxID=7888 RepID=UPI001CFAD9F6|nr:rhophilin-2 isoform X2 [Protopterus annectens]